MQQQAIYRLLGCFGLPQAPQQDDELAKQAYSWLMSYLENRRQRISSEEYQVLTSYTSVPDNSTACLYLFAHVAEQLTQTNKPTLQHIIGTFRSADIQDHSFPSYNAVPRDQKSVHIMLDLVFRTIGWVTLLYEPQISPDSTHGFSVELPMDIQGNIVHSEVLNVPARLQPSAERLPVHLLLKHIGQDLIPCPSLSSARTPPPISTRPDFFSEQVVGSYLNYATLKKVAKIELDFVTNVSLHLDFDERSRRLKIFALPSWCVLMAFGKFKSRGKQSVGSANSQHLPYLSQLLESYLYGQQHDTEDNGPDRHDYAAFCREILLSYSVLFGQKESAATLFKKDYRRYFQNHDNDRFPQDSLLLDICDRFRTRFFSRLGITSMAQQYSAQKEFPFLGSRLIRLQRFVIEQDPTDWQTLLHDKRDILRYWTFWAVILVGGLSILMSFIQILLTIAQLVVQMKQQNN